MNIILAPTSPDLFLGSRKISLQSTTPGCRKQVAARRRWGIIITTLACFLLLSGFVSSAYAQLITNPIAIQNEIDKIVRDNQLTGAVVSIQEIRTNQSWHFASGMADKKKNIVLNTTHLMQIGSTTKSFIAALVLMMEADSEKGRLKKQFNIEQPLGLWFPKYKVWKDVKIKNLLNMSSGIVNYTNEELFDHLAINPQHQWSSKELIKLAYSQKPNMNFKPGEHYEYSNTNYILLGILLEKLSNKPLEGLINERIFKKYPKRFQHIYYEPQTYPGAHFDEMAHGYHTDPAQHPQFYQQDITSVTLSWAGSAGAIISRSEDLANWSNLLFSKDFLEKKQRKELKSLICLEDTECSSGSPITRKDNFAGYGLGVGHINDPDYGEIWTHNGGTLGFHTVFLYIPKLSLSVSVIVNQIGPQIDEMDDMIYIANRVLDLIHPEK